MKFAKELESDLVPEWRAKYLDYKSGKKKLKAITRALRNIERTPQPNGPGSSTFRSAPTYASLNTPGGQDTVRRGSSSAVQPASVSLRRHISPADGGGNVNHAQTPSHALPIPGAADGERTPLQHARNTVNEGHGSQYGSFVPTPPMSSSPTWSRKGAPSLRLPGPALGPQTSRQSEQWPLNHPQRTLSNQSVGGVSAYHIGPNTSSQHSPLAARYRTMFQPTRTNSMPSPGDSKPSLPSAARRAFTFRTSASFAPNDIVLNAYREVEFCQSDFFLFLDRELDKIETFYKQKEDEATERLRILREQLHIMRDLRVQELLDASAAHADQNGHSQPPADANFLSRDTQQNGDDTKALMKKGLHLDHIYKRTRGAKTAQSMKMLGTPSGPRAMDPTQDYVRRKKPNDIPYRAAKHKLKIALAEYYRALELLKSYALLNRTAFRKITKKFDKTVNAHPSGRYMAEHVNKAYFVNSGVLESHIQAVEDLYARYFERGNHKIAVGKLRAKGARAGDYTGSVFRNGVLLGLGAVFVVQGTVYGGELLFDPDPTIVVHTSYLLQIYGGYAMMLLLSLLFCLDCHVWQKAKVNYAFIFEFDTRHNLDWRQLSEIPCFLFFCLGLIMWLNFSRFTSDGFFVYWPVVLICISVLVLFNPLPTMYHRSRFWFIISNWRLLVAGLYPVEFRDFFLGDMYCSQTYALGNLELFFCLYAHHWNNPPQCNSSHSRLLGFFSTLPGIWRALQCIRRYWDTRNVFPHLVNCGKYMCTILYYMTLSLYRIEKTNSSRATFIVFATINAAYCSVWDIVMDWSLMDPTAKHKFLRSTLGFKYTWWYYLAIVIDPIIRFNWIFYAIYGQEAQHSSLVSFFVAFSEVLRRGMWTLFRVENEHCTNVGRFRASRDIPLPYEVLVVSENGTTSMPSDEANGKPHGVPDEESQTAGGQAPSGNLDLMRSHTSGTDAQASTGPAGQTRQRRKTMTDDSPVVRAFSRVGTMLHAAHAQDFERKRRPELGQSVGKDIGEHDDDDDDDDDDATTDSEVEEVGAAIAERRQQHHPHHGTTDGTQDQGGESEMMENGSAEASQAADRPKSGDR